MTSPLVTCIIPCFNRARYIRVALDSALAQTYQPLEIIVVDDGSVDETPQVLASYGSQIRVLRQENAGTAAARNTGIAASHGKYLAWLDSDDAWLPQKIAAQTAVLEDWPQVALVYTRCSPMNAEGQPSSPTEPIVIPPPTLLPDIVYQLLEESQVLTPSCLVRRYALDAVGWFDPAFSAEDWELNLRLGRRFSFAYLDAPLTRHRIHDETKTKDRWPHAQGLLKLRHHIESQREELLAHDATPAMRLALERHTRKYAAAFYRVGRLLQKRGEAGAACLAYKEAIRRDRRVFKYYTRYWPLSVSLSLSSAYRRQERPVE